MTQADYRSKLDELDRLLNDPDVPMQPDRVWSLLAEVSHQDMPFQGGPAQPGGRPRSSGGAGIVSA